MATTLIITKIACLRTTAFENADVQYKTKVESLEKKALEDAEDNDTEKSMDVIFLDLNWQELAEIWDRFCFVMFLILTLVMNLSFIMILAFGADTQTI